MHEPTWKLTICVIVLLVANELHSAFQRTFTMRILCK
jgi:hypothetical protein